jgi:hypothetical protein
VIAKLLLEKQKDTWESNLGDLQVFINLLEVGREKRVLNKKLMELQRKKYPRDQVAPADSTTDMEDNNEETTDGLTTDEEDGNEDEETSDNEEEW